jgi:hypothetical protein
MAKITKLATGSWRLQLRRKATSAKRFLRHDDARE